MFRIIARLHFLQNLLGKFVAQLIPPFLVHNLGKYFAIKKAFYLTGLDGVEGDYIEFGVFTGSSMACAIQCARATRVEYAHRQVNFFGFDSFSGFGKLDKKDEHPLYEDLRFDADASKVEARLRKLVKPHQGLKLVPGFFDETCAKAAPATYGIDKAAVIMIDCDTFGAAATCLRFCESTIQEGTILILDDFFSYKGHQQKGVYGAFVAWTNRFKDFQFRPVSEYGMGGVVYMAHL